ncbi:MAG: hypothetical protein U5K56_01580 [Halioglobus sp.]|nr:hypothetical protein [Halioglobus sp.]
MPVIYRVDANRDGTIDHSDGDSLALFGLRRGGRLMYALDISNRKTTSFIWMLSRRAPASRKWARPGRAR